MSSGAKSGVMVFGELADGADGVVVGDARFSYGKRGAEGYIKKVVPVENYQTYLPAIGEAHPSETWLKVANVEVALVPGRPGMLEAYIVYEPDDPQDVDFPEKTEAVVPSAQPRARASSRRVPIQLHPDFTEWQGAVQGTVPLAGGVAVDDYEYWDAARQEFKEGSDHYGITHYDRPTYVVTWKQYFAEMPALSALGSVGTLAQPPAPWNTGDADQWKVSGGEIVPEGVWWSVTLYYEYDEHGWNEDVYR